MFACVVGDLPAASFDDRVQALFRPPLGETMALSPEGNRLAYTTRSGRELRLVLLDLDLPASRRTVTVEPARESADATDAGPARLRFLRWAPGGRLVYAPLERIVPLPPVVDAQGRSQPNPDGPTILAPIHVADADGKQRGTLIDARDFQETPAEARRTLADLLRTTRELQATRAEAVRWRMPHLDILGFFPGDRDQLVLQTRGAYSPPSQHLVDTRTGSVREFGGDWPTPAGEPQVFDWFRLKVVGERKVAAHPATAWKDDELAREQRDLEEKFPRRWVEILDWNESRARVLVRVTGGSDPGRIFVHLRTDDLVLEVLRVAPWLTAARLNESRFFECDAPDGARLSGFVTWPRQPRSQPPPLLLVFPEGFPGCAQPAFDPESQVFADLGFVVVRLNHRSVAGVRPDDMNALRTAIDRVSVGDGRTVRDWIAARHPDRLDSRRVATLGRGFGGYLAVRALQLHPGEFHCGMAVDAPLELRDWVREAAPAGGRIPAALVDQAGADAAKTSVLEHVAALTSPVLLAVEPAQRALIATATERLCAQLQGLGRSPTCVELDPGFSAAQPAARVAAYRRMEEFLNLHLPPSAGKVGATREGE